MQHELEQNAEAPAGSSIKTLNLGFNGDGAYSLKYTLKDYQYLDYDAVVLYTGYNDLGEQNFYVFRHRTPVFGWTGYLPLLPAFTVDKLTVWKRKLLGQSDRAIFEPQDLARSEPPASLSKQVGTTSSRNQENAAIPSTLTTPRAWQFYCDQVYQAAQMEIQDGKRVLIVTEPYISDRHVAQQQALENMIRIRFSNQPHLHYLNLGRTIDLGDKSLCWDGMHLTEEGNRRIAAALGRPVLDLLQN